MIAGKGAEKVAGLLLTLDQATAAELLKRLPDEERRVVTRTLAGMPERVIGREQQETMLKEFRATLDASEGAVAGAEQICSLLSQALGDEAAPLADRFKTQERLTRARSQVLEFDGEALGFVLRGEHPQALAVILFELGPELASIVIPSFDEMMQQELIERMVTMRPAPPELVVDLLEATLMKAASMERAQVSAGITPEARLKTVATILTKFKDEAQQNLLMNLEINAPELADRVRQQLFTFDDLMKLGPRDIQKVLSSIDTKVLATALKGASREQQDFLLGNVSKRTVERIAEERENMGAVKLSEVRQAQTDLATVARDLIQRGDIQFGGGDELVA
jgi:flagellar motor switch protein FliG